ncbi:MAG: iron-containing alcohol dehydrogenase [SAR202 cluster bacterium]|nr:iron-containing alcohol dehydrogenase [SAR202 cluster bacterium]
MIMDLRYSGYPVRIHSGTDSLKRLDSELNRLNSNRAMIVCGRSIANKTNLIDRIKSVCEPSSRITCVFDKAETSSPLPSVMEGVQLAKENNVDCIVSVGGGSSIVTTRGILILLAEQGSAFDLCTQYPPGQRPISPRLDEEKLPTISVITTPTTATNRSGTALKDPETRTRLELFDPKTRPIAVIWDKEALETASPELTKSASASLLTGVLAGLLSKNLNHLALSDLNGALEIMLHDLPLVDTRQAYGEVAMKLCAASFLYNRACDSGIGGTALGVVSAISHAIDTKFPDCSHGDAYSVMTSHGISFNAPAILESSARVLASLERFNANDIPMSGDAAGRLSEWSLRFFQSIDMPTKLSSIGVTDQDINAIARDAMEDFPMHSNIRRVENIEEIESLLSSAL